jgi:hypothetical protein
MRKYGHVRQSPGLREASHGAQQIRATADHLLIALSVLGLGLFAMLAVSA